MKCCGQLRSSPTSMIRVQFSIYLVPRPSTSI